jgi:hypothetical protein
MTFTARAATPADAAAITAIYNQGIEDGLLNTAIRAARAKAKSAAEQKKLVIVNFVEGQKSDEGYRFLSDVGISVQGQDANGAWRGACHVAQQIGCELKTTFIWREKGRCCVSGDDGTVSHQRPRIGAASLAPIVAPD